MLFSGIFLYLVPVAANITLKTAAGRAGSEIPPNPSGVSSLSTMHICLVRVAATCVIRHGYIYPPHRWVEDTENSGFTRWCPLSPLPLS